MNEKQLIENRNAKVARMEAILNLAKNENRLPTADETAEFESLKNEIQEIDNALSMNETLNKMGGMKKVESANFVSVEDLERKQFENIIRGIKNGTDEVTTATEAGVMIPTTVSQVSSNSIPFA